MATLLKHYQQAATEELRALERKRQYDANAAYRKSRTFKRVCFSAGVAALSHSQPAAPLIKVHLCAADQAADGKRVQAARPRAAQQKV